MASTWLNALTRTLWRRPLLAVGAIDESISRASRGRRWVSSPSSFWRHTGATVLALASTVGAMSLFAAGPAQAASSRLASRGISHDAGYTQPLGDAAYTQPLGVFASGAPCSSYDWQGCAGNLSAPGTPPDQYGNPMAQPGLGIPLGGIGSGSFMINRAGTFGPWDMGGSTDVNYENRILPQAAFHVRSQQGRAPAITRTLAVNTKQFGSVMPAWNTVAAGSGTYSALYPFGRIDYGDAAGPTKVSVGFWSPFVAGNDERSSQPVAYFDVQVTNDSNRPSKVSTMFTFPNAPTHVARAVQGLPSRIQSTRTGYYSSFKTDPRTGVSGVTLGASSPSNTPDSQNTEWTEAVQAHHGQTVSYTTSWNGAGDGSDVYNAFSRSGALPDAPLDGSDSAGALAVSVNLAPHQSTVIHYALAWDFPQVSFGPDNGTVWMRRYTSYYGAQETASNDYVQGSYPFHQGFAIADRNLQDRSRSLSEVLHWWAPRAYDRMVPAAIRTTSLNQLSQLVWTGTFWESGLVSTNLTPTGGEPRIGSSVPGTHLFYMSTGGGWSSAAELDVQGQTYLPIQQLFPDLEQSWVRATSEMIMQNPTGKVPGTLGTITASPFVSWQSSTAPSAPEASYFDTPIKYLIRAYGLYQQTHDPSLLREIYPAMQRAWTDDVAPRIPAGGALPIEPVLFGNTYDLLGVSQGASSVYNSGLYLLGLEIMINASRDAASLGVPSALSMNIPGLTSTLATAREAFESTFWTDNSYYRVASSGRRYTDVFSDTLWPQYQAELLGLPDLMPADHIRSQLDTEFRVLLQNKDATGHLIGAPNLVPIDGHPYPTVQLPPRSLTEEQAAENGFDKDEVWPGTNYELAATFIREGQRLRSPSLLSDGIALADAIAYQIYDPAAPAGGSFAFNEPDAYSGYDPTTYRGAGMSRNLAAWDMLAAITGPDGALCGRGTQPWNCWCRSSERSPGRRIVVSGRSRPRC